MYYLWSLLFFGIFKQGCYIIAQQCDRTMIVTQDSWEFYYFFWETLLAWFSQNFCRDGWIQIASLLMDMITDGNLETCSNLKIELLIRVNFLLS